MNRLVSQCILLMMLCILGKGQKISAEVIQMHFRLPTYPQSDRDFSLIQNFLLYQAFSEMNSEEKKNCNFSLDFEGELIITGDQEAIPSFAGALGKAIVKVVKEEVHDEVLQMNKHKYLASSKDLVENALIEEIKKEDLLAVRSSLQPLAHMLCTETLTANQKPAVPLTAASAQHHLFYALPLRQPDQKNIDDLMKTMGRASYWDLLKKKKKMDKLGNTIQHVHPLRFIGYIYNHPKLKKYMDKIMGDMFKRRGVLFGHGQQGGFSQRMTKEMYHNNLMCYLPGFAQSVGVNPDEISRFFDDHDWEGLLRYLNKKK